MATDEAALRIVLHYAIALSDCRHMVRYRLVQWKCGAHKGNLVTMVAVCGCRPVSLAQNAIAGTIVRLYKYLNPWYGDQFAVGLRQHVVESLELVLQQPLSPELRGDHGLCSLYGAGVFPAALVDLFNVHVLE